MLIFVLLLFVIGLLWTHILDQNNKIELYREDLKPVNWEARNNIHFEDQPKEAEIKNCVIYTTARRKNGRRN